MLERALSFDSDIIMVDLEDSVPPNEKIPARDTAKEWVPKLRRQAPKNRQKIGRKIMVRVNSLDTGLTGAEVQAVIGPDLYGISLGKPESVWDIQGIDRILGDAEYSVGMEPGGLKLIPWIENARALTEARRISEASPRIVAIAFGAEDFTNDMGIERTDSGEEVSYARAAIPVAARAARVASLDSPFVAFRDPEALKSDAQKARLMGYTGKFAIHPSQLEIINETFSPSKPEVEYAGKVVEAWKQAEAQGRGSADLDGRMIDVPVLKRAQQLLEYAQAVEAQG